MKNKFIVFLIGGVVAVGIGIGLAFMLNYDAEENVIDSMQNEQLEGVPYEDTEKINDIKNDLIHNSENQNQSSNDITPVTIIGQEELYKYSTVENVFNLRIELSSWLLALDPDIKEVVLDLNTLNVLDNGYIINAKADRLDDTIIIECRDGKYIFK